MASVDWRNGVKLSRRISRYPWQLAILLFTIFFVSWYGIYQYNLKQLKQETIRVSEQILNKILEQSIKNKEDIDKLYSKIKPQMGHQMSQLKAYVNFFKHHSAVESIFFSGHVDASTILLNPYLSTSILSVSKEDCDAAFNRHATQIDSHEYVAIVSLIPEVCIYNATREVIILMNMRKNIHHILQTEIDKGYFVVRLTNRHSVYEEDESSFSYYQKFDYLGTPLTYEIYPNQAYIDARLNLSFFSALLVAATLLILLLIIDKLHRFRHEKINNSKVFELGYLRKLVFYDHLTGLPNRKYLLLRLHSATFRARQYHAPFLLCFIDCDNFKDVNDGYGHNVGDELLKHIGEVVTRRIRDNDFFSRLSGDEFCLILDGCVNDAAIDVTLTKILRAIAEPFTIDTHTFSITVSIGVVVCTGSSQSPPEKLLIKADRAMYQAKHRQKGTYAIVYEDDRDEGFNTQVE
jgi:diguanylate cyclase (GGDEF)-like protein